MENIFENPSVSKNREINSEFVREVEKSKLDAYDKVNFLLTKAGLKPASSIELTIKTYHDKGITEHLNDIEVQNILNLIRNSELAYEIKEKRTDKEGYETEGKPGIKKFFKREKIDIFVGNSEKELNNLLKAWEKGDDKLIGKSLGFLDSSVEAFVDENKKMNIDNLPEEFRSSDALLFCPPTISKNNWCEELKKGKEYADFIKKISLNIYQQYLEFKKN